MLEQKRNDSSLRRYGKQMENYSLDRRVTAECELLRDFVLCNVTSNISDRSDGRRTKTPTIRAKFISDTVKTPRYQRVERRGRGERDREW